MKYRQMAKHFVYEAAVKGAKADISDGVIFGDKHKAFTDKQLAKFQGAVNEELGRMKQKLIDRKIIIG